MFWHIYFLGACYEGAEFSLLLIPSNLIVPISWYLEQRCHEWPNQLTNNFFFNENLLIFNYLFWQTESKSKAIEEAESDGADSSKEGQEEEEEEGTD